MKNLISLALIPHNLLRIKKENKLKLILCVLPRGASFLIFSLLSFYAYSVEPSKAFVELAKKVRSGVVNISTTKAGANDMVQIFPGYFMPFTSPEMTASGSGFIVDKKGLIITNSHVVKDFDKIQVQFVGDDKYYSAKVLGSDQLSDIALLKVDVNKRLQPIALGDSSKLEVGEWVAAIGNPHGYGHTMTKGIISAIKREIDDLNLFPLLQTDASINPGNSGGPLVNLKGEVIGVNQAIVRGASGISFAIPINNVKEVLKDLKSFGFVRKGFIGVNFQGDGQQGVVISHVVAGSPAQKAGLKAQDRIMSFAGKKIKKAIDLPKAVRQATIGKRVNLKIMRKGKFLTLSIVPQAFEKNKYSSVTPNKQNQTNRKISGVNILDQFELIEPKASNLKAFGHPGWAKHPIVFNLKRNSQAFNQGLREGDMLYQINGQALSRVSTAKRLLKKGRSYKLNLLRYNSYSDRYQIVSIQLKL